MLTLSESDREIIALISDADDSGVQMELLEDCYVRGIRAGLLRAAAEIEHISPMTKPSGCVLLIRALAEL